MSDLIKSHIEQGVATLSMNSGKVNAFDHNLIDALKSKFDELKVDATVKAISLTGQEGVFSAGFDLKIMKSGPSEAEALIKSGGELLRDLYLYPKPLVFAAGGHAIAMGAVMLMVADYRIGVTGEFKTGLNETHIGMALPEFFIALCKERVPLNLQTQAIILGELYPSYDARDYGFYDVVSTPDQLDDQCFDKTKEIADYIEPKAFAENKRRLREALVKTYEGVWM
ncbi:MAG: crotonase/enoyl-CoA hydratase family protein [Pseudobacteriovorax sp.]|nr:crotonase/enoyl-CoA hydratase family protein [Pseudobacteriovorax sp.]